MTTYSNNISSEYNYIPIQWTNYYVKNNYGKDLDECHFLDQFIDKSKNILLLYSMLVVLSRVR